MTGWRLVQERERELREAAMLAVDVPVPARLGDVLAWVTVAIAIALIAGVSLG